MSTCYVDTSVASLSKRVSAMWLCIDKSFLSIFLIWWFLHAVHWVVRHQPNRWYLSWCAGRREHAADVGGRVNILAVLHLVCQALPVDMEAGDTGVGGQNIPLELREWKQHYALQRGGWDRLVFFIPCFGYGFLPIGWKLLHKFMFSQL